MATKDWKKDPTRKNNAWVKKKGVGSIRFGKNPSGIGWWTRTTGGNFKQFKIKQKATTYTKAYMRKY